MCRGEETTTTTIAAACEFGSFAPIELAWRERSHEERCIDDAMRPPRMRRSADARGKCKYVKARPEFSYSRCPSPRRGVPPRSPPFPLHRAYSMQALSALRSLLRRPAAALPTRRSAARVCTYLRPRERHARACMFCGNAKIARARIESDSSLSSAASFRRGDFSAPLLSRKRKTRVTSDRSRSTGTARNEATKSRKLLSD